MSLLPGSASPALFLQRLERVRHHAGLDSTDKTTMLLMVAGADGCSSPGSHALLQYLLFGACGLDALSGSALSDASQCDDDAWDEVVVGVHAAGVRIACAAATRPTLERLTREVRGVEITSRLGVVAGGDEEAEAQADEDELFKIHAFIALTQGFERILVPTLEPASSPALSQAQANSKAHAEIELWPIVQAYGLDELGRHGFFTLTHQVHALPVTSFTALAEVDSAHILHLLSNRLPAFTSQFHNTCSRLLAAAVDPVAGGALTVRQLNQEAKGWWEYGLDSLTPEERVHRVNARAPGVAVFGPSGAAAADADTLVRAAGAKHYTGLTGYYSRLLAAQPYLPLSPLLPLLSSRGHSPLHAVVTLSDPLSQLHAVRTILLRQVTPVQENELEVLEYLIPAAWKRKKRRVVADEDDDGSSRNNTDNEAASDEDESESEEESESESEDPDTDEEEQKESLPKVKAPKPAKAAPPPPARLKKESPGLKDATLLHVLYESLVSVVASVVSDLASSGEVATFPSFEVVRARVLERVALLAAAKWILPHYTAALTKQAYRHAPDAASSLAPEQVLQVELARIDALGRRTSLDLAAGAPIEPRCMYAFSLHLHRIPSRELLSLTDDDLLLGSVGFGESFVWNHIRAPAAPNTGAALSPEELAEERRKKEDPTYFGTGMSSSSASAPTAGGADAPKSASSLLVLTASLPSRIILPSFFQAFESKALACMLSSYVHASASSALTPAAEVAALGLVPLHGDLGKLLADGFSPRLQSNLLATPPTSASQSSIGLRDPGYTVPVFVPQRLEAGMQALLLCRDDAFLSSSSLALSSSLLLSSSTCPILHGSFVFFEHGFVFTGASCGSIVIDFARHVLESCWYDGTSEEWPTTHEADSDDEDDDRTPDDEDEDDGDDGDALFVMDLLEPSPSEAASSPYTLLNSLDASTAASLGQLAPGNTGVTAPASKFAKASCSVAIVLAKGSSLKRAFLATVQAAWKGSFEDLNVHNDYADEVPQFCRPVYKQLQEQHEHQRREARKAKRASAADAQATLVLPDATCDFLADLTVHEQMQAHPDTTIVNQAHTLLSRHPVPAKGKASAPVVAASGPLAIPVSLVIGVPGACHAEVLASVRDASSKANAAITWTAVALVADDSLDAKGYALQLQQALATLRPSSTSSQHRVLIAVSTYEGVLPVATLLQALLTSLATATHTFVLSSVTTLLHSACFFVGPSHSLTVPGVTDQLVSGWTQGCLLVTPAPPTLPADDALVAVVRRRVGGLHSRWPNLVRTAGRRIPFHEIADLLCSDRFARPNEERRRLCYALSHPPSPRPALCSGAGVRREFFHLPGSLLLDRSRFIATLLEFTRQREVYHTDEERETEASESTQRWERVSKESLGPSASASSHAALAGRITFTTGSSSLPSSWTSLHVVAFLKFHDAVSNAGGVSTRFVEFRASDGRITAHEARHLAPAPNALASRSIEDVAAEGEELKTDDDSSAASSLASSPPASVPIPLSVLPLEVRACVSSSLSGVDLSSASASCLLVVYGRGLERALVARELLLPAVAAPRTHEPPNSRWNELVKREQQEITQL